MILKETFVHHVLFWLNDKADLPRLIEGLNSLTAIEVVRNIHIGVPADTEGGPVERSYDVSLLTIFSNKAELDAYDTHPDHQLFVNNYAKPLCAKVTVLDSVNA